MSLKGSFRTMPISDLFDWIERRFVCGSLTVERGSVTRSFHFDSGYVTSASSDDPTEYLGQLLVRRGLVTEAALNEAFRVQADTGVLLGKILLMVGAIDEASLTSALELKIREAVCDAMSWQEGSFVFEPTPTSARTSAYEVTVNLREAIDAGRERAARWRKIHELIDSDETWLWIADPAARARLATEAGARALFDAVDRGLAVGQIVMEQSDTRFELMDRLCSLVEAGALAVDKRRARRLPTAEMSAEDLESAARGRARGGDKTGAFELVRKALDKEPDNPAVLKLYRELERAVFAELSRTLLSTFCVPKLLRSPGELDGLELDKAERYLTKRIDGRWDLLSLMRTSPLRQVEVLLTCKRLADRGIIAL
jgi:hypothetical protein